MTPQPGSRAPGRAVGRRVAPAAEGAGHSLRARVVDRLPVPVDPTTIRPGPLLAFMAAHVALGVASDVLPSAFVTAHAVATLAVVAWVLVTPSKGVTLVCAAAYVTSAEVLWRMNGAGVPWEIGKYVVALIFVVALVRLHDGHPRGLTSALVYLLLLSPAVVITVERFGVLGAREILSFNWMIHVTLAVGVVFFRNMVTTRRTMAVVLWFLLAPIVSINAIASLSTSLLASEDFDRGISNVASSGGFGPNQVSALLGLGLLATVYLVILDGRPAPRLVAAVGALWFGTQGVLTFSRGGTFNVLVALVAAAPFALARARTALRAGSAALLAVAVILLVVVPFAQRVTGGAFGERFSSRSTTLRGDLASQEIETFSENPAFGVGVGLSVRTDRPTGEDIPSHTEYTRLMAEHGVLGIVAMGMLVVWAVAAIARQPTMLGRAFSASTAVWALVEMSHSATRIVAVGFVFALGACTLLDDRDPQASEPSPPATIASS